MPRLGTFGISSKFAYGDQETISPAFWISPALTLSTVADGTTISSVTNLGSAGGYYSVTAAANIPTKATQRTYPVLNFNGTNQLSYVLSNQIDITNQGSLFFVGYQTANRMIALGGAAPSNGNCFFGWGSANNTTFLLRNTADGGMTLNGLSSVAGLKAFGVIKTGSTVKYYDNNLSSATLTGITGTFIFGKVGDRDFSNNVDNQPSTGVLGDVLYFRQAVDDAQAKKVMLTIKARYGIA